MTVAIHTVMAASIPRSPVLCNEDALRVNAKLGQGERIELRFASIRLRQRFCQELKGIHIIQHNTSLCSHMWVLCQAYLIAKPCASLNMWTASINYRTQRSEARSSNSHAFLDLKTKSTYLNSYTPKARHAVQSQLPNNYFTALGKGCSCRS